MCTNHHMATNILDDSTKRKESNSNQREDGDILNIGDSSEDEE